MLSRNRRVGILLLALVLIAGITVWERWRARNWTLPLHVAIYPIAAEAEVSGYVAQLKATDYQDISEFLTLQAMHWRKLAIPDPQIVLMAPLQELPPRSQPRRALDAIQASLSLRWYAFRQTRFWPSLGTVRLFVLYHPLRFNQPLPDSHGLQKGLLGLVHVYASDTQRAQNNVVIAHELLHTLGATDKYDAQGQPRSPEGLAEPYREPLYPQSLAEIMAGRIALAPDRAEIPRHLEEAVVGYSTAAEIGW